MCDEQGGGDECYLTSDDWRLGYVKPRKQPWLPVTYADVDGLAVFEGCILLGETAEVENTRKKIDEQSQTAPDLFRDRDARLMGSGIVGAQYLWEKRTIPYEIDPALPRPERVTEAMQHWQERTTITFVERTTKDNDYVRVRPVASGCASFVGCQGGRQDLILAADCSVGNVIHELGHAIGLWHEQSRGDRDQWVEIVYSKVAANRRSNFDQHIDDGVDLGEYDYGSIMHYPAGSFSVDGSATIVARRPLPAGVVMGQRTALSDGDVKAVETMYQDVAMPGSNV